MVHGVLVCHTDAEYSIQYIYRSQAVSRTFGGRIGFGIPNVIGDVVLE